MAALIERLASRPARSAGPVNSFDDWVGLWGLESLGSMLHTTMPGNREEFADGSFLSLVAGAYQRNAIVFACLALRARVFSQIRFQFQQLRGGPSGKPGKMFGTADLGMLEHPEPGMSTGDLLQQAILHADLAGTAFFLWRRDGVRLLRPDWVSVTYGSRGDSELGDMWDPTAEVIAYSYYEGGLASGSKPVIYEPEEVAPFVTTRHPMRRTLGISLLLAGLREVMADNASTSYKLSFFENAATPNLALKFPPSMKKETALEWIELFEQEHRGASKAFKTLFLGAGVEADAVGLDFQKIDFAQIQGRAETRIAGLTGMHPVVAALSEGLQGSSLNSGNFGQAIRLTAGATWHPLWKEVCGVLEDILPPPSGSRLWYDPSDIPLLREEAKDRAETLLKKGQLMRNLADGGWDPDEVTAAVESEDLGALYGKHTGRLSVQLQEPGAQPAPSAPSATHRVRQDFWPTESPYAALGLVGAGETYASDHPLVIHFPSMFEQVAADDRAVTRDQVYRARAELQAAGRPYGDRAVAALLNVSESTAKRRRLEDRTA